MDTGIIPQASALQIRDNVEALEMLCLDKEQVECTVQHHFHPGIYMREVFVPAGTFAIGHHQKFAHLCMFTKGKVEMVEEDGTTSVITAPMVFTSPPGRKIGYVIEDMVWLNIYATEETDVEKLEETYLDKSEYFMKFHENKERCLCQQ